jgi:hypothetical protein
MLAHTVSPPHLRKTSAVLLWPSRFSYLLLLAIGPALCSKTNRQASLRSNLFCLRAQSLKASGAHPALCSGVPRFSCAKALVAQRKVAAAAMERQFDFEIILDHSFDGLPLLEVILERPPCERSLDSPALKKLNTGT